MTEPEFLSETRVFYDAIAVDYAARFRDVSAERPLDRAMLAAFADLVRADGGGPVAELGCGTGRVTAHLHRLGLDVLGIDLSPGMLATARAEHPELRFEVGSLLDLPLPDAALAGAVAWYSIIHTPRERLPEVFAEFHRVLAPGGHLLLAFQVGDEPLRIEQAFGLPVALDFRRRRPELVAELAAGAGLEVTTRLVRERGREETAPQAVLLARRPA
ncbi:class I SAM-dependent methyltransferase [Kitasatospora sp. CM 4170]|uniref:Class I SAM-dependent DNA methyltransferase n=1 Tax=Kitasatospora aburaviensis TaxID=67265 RepID=A0ABW1F9Q7_9ACTN|nr:class I SAM-dependent methyltransferase [Kitasatospora sp. CM 4170]WNM46080.1 class I SAM-dependent methyltransferase [Kitasatospora sp. CM 4170]